MSLLLLLQILLLKNVKQTGKALQLTKSFQGSFPNTDIICRIRLKVPVAMARGQRSFPTLKMIKNYMKTIMAPERLNGLTLLSIKKEVTSKTD
jgi:hypothetical protein